MSAFPGEADNTTARDSVFASVRPLLLIGCLSGCANRPIHFKKSANLSNSEPKWVSVKNRDPSDRLTGQEFILGWIAKSSKQGPTEAEAMGADR